jgi:hypothetical protein
MKKHLIAIIIVFFSVANILIAQQAHLQIESEPDIAVYINNQFKGITSQPLNGLIISGLKPGKTKVLLKKDGFEDKVEEIILEAEKVYLLKVKFLTKKSSSNIYISQSGEKAEEREIVKKEIIPTGSLIIQSLPIEIKITIQGLGIESIKNKDKWKASNLRTGAYELSATFNNMILQKEIRIFGNDVTRVFVDFTKNKIIIKSAGFRSANSFSEGLAYVEKNDEGKETFSSYYIDTIGTIVIPDLRTKESFSNKEEIKAMGGDFKNGAAVINFEKLDYPYKDYKKYTFIYIDKEGKSINKSSYTRYGRSLNIANDRKTLAFAFDHQKHKQVFIGPKAMIEMWGPAYKGQKFKPYNTVQSTTFNEGIVFTYKRFIGDGRYFDLNKEDLIPGKFYEGKKFSEGFAAVKKSKNGLYGFINNRGEEKLDYIFELIYEAPYFSEGLCAAKTYNDKLYGFIDKTGKFVIERNYVSAQPFSEGLAAVLDNNSNKWGFINHNGEVVVDYKYAEVKKFSEGLAPVKMNKNGLWGYINKLGELKIDFKFNLAEPFNYNRAAVQYQNYPIGYYRDPNCFINRKGDIVIY